MTVAPTPISQLAASPTSASAPAYVPVKVESPDLVIQARKGWIGVDWGELIRYRELLLFLIWRDVKVKYKQAVLGFAWAILVPVIQALLFSMIGNLSGWNTHTTTPYIIYVYSGLLPWLFIQSGISNGGMSLVNQQGLLSKIYLPRLFMPTATIGTALIDMALSSVVLVVIMAFYGYVPSHNIWAVVPLLGISVLTSLGLAYFLSALTVTFRDMRFLIPFVSQLLMWTSAAVISANIFGKYKKYFDFQPIFGLIAGWRWALLGEEFRPVGLAVSAIFAVVIFVFGLFYFRKAERRFADIA